MGWSLRRLLLTPQGRRALVGAYLLAGAVTVVVYWVRYGAVYATGQAVIIGGAVLWMRWCLARSRR
jgi:hypothetical protein